jgi:hypothetical protein
MLRSDPAQPGRVSKHAQHQCSGPITCTVCGPCPKAMRISQSVAGDQDRVCKIVSHRHAAITGHDRPWRTRHLAAAVLGAHDPRRSRLRGSHGLHAFQPVKHGLVAHPADWPHSSFHPTPSLQGGRPVNSGQRATCRIRKERRTVRLND